MGKAFNLKNGTILLVTEAPGGLYNASQLKKIAAISDSSMAIVKATEDQRLALFVKAADASKIATELKSIGLGIRHYQDGLHQPTACIGELCPQHEQDALGSAMALTKELAEIKLASPLKIGINGCAACCVPCHTLDISIVGDSQGYRMSIGGKTSQIPEMASFVAEAIPADKLPGMVKKVIGIYQKNAEEGESLQDLIERIGASEFIAALAPYSQDASAGAADPFGDVGPADDSVSDSLELEDIGDSDSLELGAPIEMDDSVTDDSLDLGAETLATAELEDLAEVESGDELSLDLNPVSDNESLELSMEDDLSLGGDAVSNTGDIDVSAENSMGDDDALLDADINGINENWQASSKQDLSLSEDLVDEETVLTDIEDLALDSASKAPALQITEDDALMEDTDFSLPDAEMILDDDSLEAAGTDESLDVGELEEIAAEAPSVEELESLDDEESFEAQLEVSIAEEESLRAATEVDENSQDRDEALTILEETAAQPLVNQELLDEDTIRRGSPAPKPAKTPAKKAASKGQTLVGITVSDDSHLQLEFENGALMSIAPEKIENGSKTLKFGQQTIHIELLDGGYQVEADGISLFCPFANSSAA